MTDREKAIVMAHTGICMLAGEKFGVFHAYIEDIMGRPVYTHELAIQSISDEIKEKSRDDFIKLCKEEQEPCDDAISRVETVKFLANHSNEFEDEKIRMAFQSASSLVNNPHNLPPVQPQPKTGHWILTSDDDLEYCTCSECGYQNGENWMIGSQIKFCQECGAKMQESEEV